MSNELSDFVDTSLTPYPITSGGIQIYGKRPKLTIDKICTIKWNIEDDNGTKHHIQIPNSIYVPEGNQQLLSPQHWSAEANKVGNDNPDSTRSIQCHDRNVLYFGSLGQHKKTVYYSTRSNVPTFYTAAGNRAFKAFTASVHKVHGKKIKYLEEAVCHPSIISDEEDNDDPAVSNIDTPISTPQPTEPLYSPVHINQTVEHISDFNSSTLVPVPALIEEEEEPIAATSDRGELLRWHYYCLGRLSFTKLKLLAVLNIIPCRLALVKPPKCACCI